MILVNYGIIQVEVEDLRICMVLPKFAMETGVVVIFNKDLSK
jgi:hypothetical protein